MVNRIGIVGDVHAEHQHLAMALDHLADLDVDTILCTGDIVDGAGDVDTCVTLLQSHKVQTVRGNHDRWVLQDKARHVPNAHKLQDLSDPVVAYLDSLPTHINIATGHGSLMLCHGVGANDLQKVWPGTDRMPAERSKQLDELIDAGEHSLMINGHVHYRTMIHFNALTLLNAGTLRGDHNPGFSFLDLTEKVVRGFEFHCPAKQAQKPSVKEVKSLDLAPTASAQVFKNTQHFDNKWQPVTLYA
jgi:predicted phosphodiesterase